MGAAVLGVLVYNKGKGMTERHGFRHNIRQWMKLAVQNLFLPAVYLLFRLRPVDANKILLADAHSHRVPYSMRRMEKKLIEAGFVIEYHISDYQADGFFSTFKNMLRFMKSYATAGGVVLCDNFLPVASCRKRKETFVIQLWHGGGALKKFGYSTQDDIPSYYKSNVFRNYSLVTVSGKRCVEAFTEAMRQPQGVVQPLGISRMDACFDARFAKDVRQRFEKSYPEAKGKKVLLWAPTFRGTAKEAKKYRNEGLDFLKKDLGEDWYIINSLHPHAKLEDEHPLCTEELLAVTDVLVSDYSSIIFDYLFYKKTLILYVPDYQEYSGLRGFYTPFGELPGKIVCNKKELSEAVLNYKEEVDLEKIEHYLSKYLDACDGHATERILTTLVSARENKRKR